MTHNVVWETPKDHIAINLDESLKKLYFDEHVGQPIINYFTTIVYNLELLVGVYISVVFIYMLESVYIFF